MKDWEKLGITGLVLGGVAVVFGVVLEWQMKDEYFIFGGQFNIDQAKKILRDNPRDIQHIDLTPMAGMSGFLSLGAPKGEVDIDFPVILANINGEHLPIDGWHRIRLAKDLGVLDRMPVLILTEEESKEIRG